MIDLTYESQPNTEASRILMKACSLLVTAMAFVIILHFPEAAIAVLLALGVLFYMVSRSLQPITITQEGLTCSGSNILLPNAYSITWRSIQSIEYLEGGYPTGRYLEFHKHNGAKTLLFANNPSFAKRVTDSFDAWQQGQHSTPSSVQENQQAWDNLAPCTQEILSGYTCQNPST
jgi:hypothetical protein